MKNWIAVVMMSMAFVCVPADAAKRLGGGKSTGQQSNQVTQREAAKPATPNVPPLQLPQRQAGHGLECWVGWLQVWVLRGLRIRWALVQSLVSS